ncbi:MAG: alginate export family protein, partial [Candidatus Omnitrophica bacterium]|nr:alginate export family protein [Candidatus Omnitrophota bacterium]
SGFGEKVNAILSQIRVRVDADLTDNVSTTVRLLNERVWGAEAQNNLINNGQDSNIDLDLAYATLKEFLYSPLTLTVGRQELRYGNALVIGDIDTNAIAAGHGRAGRMLPDSLDDLSLRKSFDAVKATLNYDPLVIDLVASKIFKNDAAQNNDTNLYGINAAYALRKSINLEGYWWQRSRKAAVMNNVGTIVANDELDKRENLNVVGGRAVVTTIKGLTVTGEAAYQFGNRNANTTLYPDEATDNNYRRNVQAWAIQGAANYALPVAKKYVPMVGASYTYLSGDKYLGINKTTHGWDPMFEDQNGGTIFNKIFKATNYQLFSGSVSAKPMDDLKLSLDAYYLMLNERYTQPAFGTPINLSGVNGDPLLYQMLGRKALGWEMEAGITYDYTEDVQFGLTGGVFTPGAAFSSENRNAAKQVMGSMKVTF